MMILAILLAAAATTPPPAATARPKGTLSVEPDEAGDETPTPLPQGDERKAIGDYIRDNSSEIRECYATRLRERPTLTGKVVTRFEIGPNGHVIGAMADGIADKELIRCIVTAVRKFEFEKPASGGKLRVAFPFKFEPTPR